VQKKASSWQHEAIYPRPQQNYSVWRRVKVDVGSMTPFIVHFELWKFAELLHSQTTICMIDNIWKSITRSLWCTTQHMDRMKWLVKWRMSFYTVENCVFLCVFVAVRGLVTHMVRHECEEWPQRELLEVQFSRDGLHPAVFLSHRQ